MKNIVFILLFIAVGFYPVANAQITYKTKQNIKNIKAKENTYIGKPFTILLKDFDGDIISYRKGILDDGLTFISLTFEDENTLSEKKSKNLSYSVFTIFLNTNTEEKNILFKKSNNKRVCQYNKDNLNAYENLIILGITSNVER